MEKDPFGSISAIPARPRAGSGRIGKTRKRLRFTQRRFARDAFGASGRFAPAKSAAKPAGDKSNSGDWSGRWLDRCGIRGGTELRFSGSFARPIDPGHGDCGHCRTGVAELRARQRIIDRGLVPRTFAPFDKYETSPSNNTGVR